MRFMIPIFTLSLLAASCNAFAAGLTVPGNRHNFSNTSTAAIRATLGSGETRICVFCHTPHSASADSALWNRNDPAATFALYSSATLYIDDAGIVATSKYTDADQSAYPNGATRMCLSCHDGVSAIGDVLNGPSIAMTGTMPAGGVVTLDKAHPVSFVYTAAVRDYINTQETTNVTGGVYKLPPAAIPLDSQQRMQCTTCHDPHDDTRAGAYDLPFWRYTTGTTGPAAAADYDFTCQACHDDTGGDLDWTLPGGAPNLPHR